MISTKDLLVMKENLEKKKTERDRLLGRRDSLLESLREEGYETLEEAEEGLEKIADEINEMDDSLSKDLKAFKEKYKDLVDK